MAWVISLSQLNLPSSNPREMGTRRREKEKKLLRLWVTFRNPLLKK